MPIFKRTPEVPVRVTVTTPTEFPEGSVVVTESGRWYLKGKYKFLIPTDRVFKSWSFPLVINGTDSSLINYVKNGRLGFRTGTLIWNDGTYYLVSGNEKRRLSGPDPLLKFGIDAQRAIWVSDDELELHKTGEVF